MDFNARSSTARCAGLVALLSCVMMREREMRIDSNWALRARSFGVDVPETDRALAESYRVLKPGGFLQFSIAHPCYDTPYRRNLRDEKHRTYAIEVANYFEGSEGEVDEWLFKAAPPQARQGLRKFTIPRFRRTLSFWLNLLIETGFHLEHVREPRPNDETVAACPDLQDAQVVAYFLHLRARKPAVAA